jgi:hypothetical protein
VWQNHNLLSKKVKQGSGTSAAGPTKKQKKKVQKIVFEEQPKFAKVNGKKKQKKKK